MLSKFADKFNNIVRRGFSGTERSRAVKKNIISSILLRGISIMISFMLVPLTIGYVSAELYGVWLTLSSIMTWLGFLDIGFTQGLKNKLTEAIAYQDWNKGKALVSTTYIMMLIIFVPICILLECIIPFINWSELLNVDIIYNIEIQRVMYVMIAFFCLQMVVNVIVSVIAAFQKVALSSSFTVIGQLLSLIIIFILTKTVPASLLSLAFSISAMPILVTIIASYVLFNGKYKNLAPSIKYFDKRLVGDLFNLGYKFFIINIQVVVLYQSTNILISNLSSPLDVTTYNIAYKYMNISMMLYTIITAPLWPAYTDAYVKQDFNWMKNVRRKMTKIFLLSAVCNVIMVLFSQTVYSIWIGDDVYIPLQMTIMVALYVIVYCWMNLNGTLIVGMGTIKLQTIIDVIGMCVHIPLSLLLGKHFGAYGVLVSMIFINLAYAFIFNIQVNKILNQSAKGFWIK